MTEEYTDIQTEYNKRKTAFEEAFKDFHKQVFSSKVLDSNKSSAVKNTEMHLIDKMINSAIALDTVNSGEGLLALSTIAVRELLTMRDRVNELEYLLYKNIKEVTHINKELGLDQQKK